MRWQSWLILKALLKKWVAEGVASKVSNPELVSTEIIGGNNVVLEIG
jgi:hypothetical protein